MARSVFNFYQPVFRDSEFGQDGEIEVTPEFQILDSSTAISLPNILAKSASNIVPDENYPYHDNKPFQNAILNNGSDAHNPEADSNRYTIYQELSHNFEGLFPMDNLPWRNPAEPDPPGKRFLANPISSFSINLDASNGMEQLEEFLDELNEIICYGRMSAKTRSVIRQALLSPQSAGGRNRLAVQLLLGSPDSAIQK